MKDGHAERLDKFNRACDWLSRKYNRPLPCIELSPVPLDFWKNAEREFIVKGRFSVRNGKPTIFLYDGDDVIQGLFHEFHHYYDWLLGQRLDSDTSTLEGHLANLEEEREIESRAWQDMLDFFGLRKGEFRPS